MPQTEVKFCHPCSAVVHMCRADCALRDRAGSQASQRTVAVSYQDAVQVAPGSSAPRQPPTLAEAGPCRAGRWPCWRGSPNV
eukprot:scaffold3132_cov119-Isochrysis_galbana.AAC.9